MRRSCLTLLLIITALATGCSGATSVEKAVKTGADERPRAGAVAVATPGEGSTPESTVGTTASGTGGSGGTPAAPFTAATQASGGSGFDADTILGVRHGVHEGYERVVLDLGAGEEPAGVTPRWTLVSPKGDGLLRVSLPSTSATAVSDGRLGDGLLKGFHVVRAPEDGMFVDVFAREAFRYRVLDLADPARLVVDFQPADAPLERPLPAVGNNTVLVEPRRGAGISDPLTISGYSRNPEASNTIVLANAGGKTLVRRTIISNDWTSTWGYFEATLDLPPFRGKGTLKVGAASARDGSFEGVEIPAKGN